MGRGRKAVGLVAAIGVAALTQLPASAVERAPAPTTVSFFSASGDPRSSDLILRVESAEPGCVFDRRVNAQVVADDGSVLASDVGVASRETYANASVGYPLLKPWKELRMTVPPVKGCEGDTETFVNPTIGTPPIGDPGPKPQPKRDKIGSVSEIAETIVQGRVLSRNPRCQRFRRVILRNSKGGEPVGPPIDAGSTGRGGGFAVGATFGRRDLPLRFILNVPATKRCPAIYEDRFG